VKYRLASIRCHAYVLRKANHPKIIEVIARCEVIHFICTSCFSQQSPLRRPLLYRTFRATILRVFAESSVESSAMKIAPK
jgi:hypothetical protein